MGATTGISWTDHTYNPWWGCSRVSPGCQHCYAETFAHRLGLDVWGTTSDRRTFGPKHWNEPRRWNTAAQQAGRPALVFCASMADVFEDRPDLDEPRRQLWDLIADTPALRWQLLTKRPENVRRLVPPDWLGYDEIRAWSHAYPVRRLSRWPAHVWIGTSVEDAQRARERLPHLLEIPAPVRFLSCEPLLGPVADELADHLDEHPGSIHWIIAGGESGPRHRPLDLDHARDLRDLAAGAGIPFYYKQTGGRTPTAGGNLLDGRTHQEFPADAGRHTG